MLSSFTWPSTLWGLACLTSFTTALVVPTRNNAGLAARQLENCSPAPAVIENLWTVDNLQVNYTNDETVRLANVTFVLLNTQTKYRETVGCSLRFNSICEIDGTPGDKQLSLYVQFMLDVAYITITQPVPCSPEDEE